MERLFFDLRQAARTLRRSPGFALVTVVTLGLGIGASTALFTVLRSVVINPLPYPESDRLVWLGHDAPGINFYGLGLSPGLVGIYDERSETLEQVGFWNVKPVTLTGGANEPRSAVAVIASASLHQLLGARPALGRLLTPADDRPQSERVAVLSHAFWKHRYGGDVEAIGRRITVDGELYTVVGVLSAGFDFPAPTTELWLDSEVVVDAESFGSFGGFQALALRKPSANLDDVRRDMNARIDDLLARAEPAERQLYADARLAASPVAYKVRLVGGVQRRLWILFGAVGFVLLVACANIGTLFLVRAQDRRRETAVRVALGAGRRHLARLFLAESALLAALGGAAGLLMTQYGVRLLILAAPTAIPRLNEVGVDGGALLFSAAVTLGSAMVFGLAPIIQGTVSLGQRAAGIGARLQQGVGVTTGTRALALRRLLVVAQVALALVLSVGSGLMVRSVLQFRAVDPGFSAARLLRFGLTLPEARYPTPVSAAAFHQELLDRLAALPGVDSAAAARGLPLEGSSGGGVLLYERDGATDEEALPPLVMRTRVTPGYFKTFQVPLISGRFLTRVDGEDRSGSIVVTRDLAELYWPGETAVGRQVATERPAATAPPRWLTIVGVVGNHKASVAAASAPLMMMPMLGADSDFAQSMSYALRTSVPPTTVVDTVRAAVWKLDADLPIGGLQTFQQVVDRAAAPMLFTTGLLALASMVALVLGSVGVSGLLAYTVRQRIGEIGVRMALGARGVDMRRMMVSEGARIGAIGVAVGLAGSLLLARTMRSLLFGVAPADPLTYLVVAVALFVVVLLATYVPARRAARVNPLDALRAH